MPRNSQDGLEWERRVFETVPRWTRQPSIPAIENVCRHQLNISSEDLCCVSFFAAGAFNKLYRVDCADQSLLMRVSLPVHPHHKTRGEVATLDWVRHNTAVPVPKVVAFDDSNDNEIGFEWIFMDNRLNYDVPRGPFSSSYAYLNSQLQIIILEQTTAIAEAEDDNDKEDAEEILVPARRLLSLLPKVFPQTEDGYAELTVLWHDDLNMRNILVDEKGEITAIVDWECVSALPIWMTTNMPTFLQGNSRSEELKRDNYGDETPEETVASENSRDLDRVDNEGKNSLYWIHRMEYEATQLREVYKTRLRQRWPDWPLQDSQIKVDFYEAILQCSAGVFVKMVNRWVDHIESGDMIRWAEA